LTPIPPTPTFTPTPSPTPIFYVVQSGDTLLGIAQEYGVDMTALQNANGLADPQYLSIGESLIIPVEIEKAEQPQSAAPLVENLLLPTPTPLPLSIAGVVYYKTPVGGIWCMGEVVNETQGAVTNMQVQVTLMDSLGTPLISEVTLAAADYLPPGARAPFGVLFQNPPAEANNVQALLLRAEPVGPITAGFVPMDVTKVEGAVSGPQYRVQGTLLNSGTDTIPRIAVVAVIYDDAGKVLAYRQAFLVPDQPLGPGGMLDFSVLLTPQGGKSPATMRVVAWGDLIPTSAP
jgi:LysM repeat protein